MHTATRLALPLIDRVRETNPAAHICAYGLYAPLNEAVLREHGVDTVLGPEFEQELADVAMALDSKSPADSRPEGRAFWLPDRRVVFIKPDRSDLPALAQYATLQVGDTCKIVGYTEATR